MLIIGHLTHKPAVVPAVIKEQLLVRVNLCGCTEEQFTIGRVRHQVLLFTGTKYTNTHIYTIHIYYKEKLH